MMVRMIQRIRSFMDPQPDPAFAQRMDDARRIGVMAHKDAQRGEREVRKKIDSIYDRTVIAKPQKRKGQDDGK